jgi:hypothetical protein
MSIHKVLHNNNLNELVYLKTDYQFDSLFYCKVLQGRFPL